LAKVLHGNVALGSFPAQGYSLRSVWTLRLTLGFIALLGAMIFFLGTNWDIQWHTFIGRDRTLIPPHIMMLGGVAMSSLAALVAILIETTWTRRSSTLSPYSVPFADIFHGPLGAYTAGFGALGSAIAFPLDSYWHALYGIDVTIWAPFHIMIIVGMGIAALGASYMLASAAHLATRGGAFQAARAGYMGTLIAFATMLSILALLTLNAVNSKNFIALPLFTINVFSLLAGLLGAWTFVAIASALPWRWAASTVCGLSFLLVALGGAMVPPAMDFLMSFEHLSFRANPGNLLVNPHLPVVALEWPGTSLILAAILIDLVMLIARRKNWSRRTQTIVLSLVALAGSLPILPIDPLLSLEIWHMTGFGFLVSLLLIGLLGTFIGTWLGRGMGETMQHLER
jgi:hypothetical protein